MDKLKTLKTSTWKNIDTQAENIHKLVSKYQEDGKTEVSISGTIHKVNKVILQTNGFTVVERTLDYHTGHPSYTISWD